MSVEPFAREDQMTRDEIIRMARAAQLAYGTDDSLLCSVEKFFKAAYEAGAAAERKACAKVCEEDAFVDQWKGLAEAAKRIRARGKE
jgi:hypothetical protein